MPLSVVGLLIAGLILLLLGAELLVRGSSRLAAAIGVSPLVIGLTVVAFGTSAPELAVSARSALAGNEQIAVGNVVGSNIFNILFILGLAAMITPMVVQQRLVRLDVPLMIGLSLLVYLLGLTGRISRIAGIFFVMGLIAYTVFSVRQSRRETAAVREQYVQQFGGGRRRSYWLHGAFILSGLTMLVLGSQWLVDSASRIAQALGVSELIIGLTIVAAGTSLPEVATSVLAAIRGERDIAVGNVVGSNIFNIVGVLGLGALVGPGGLRIPPAAMTLDIPFMVAVAVGALPVFFTGYAISRWEGAVFLFYYLAYTAYLLLGAMRHDLLPLFSMVMVMFVLPLTLLTAMVVVAREFRARRRRGARPPAN